MYGRPMHRGSVQHLQELHQVVVNRGNQRLNQEDVGLPAVGVQLNLDTVVAETVDGAAAEGHSQVTADIFRQLSMRVPAEDHNVAHCPSFRLESGNFDHHTCVHLPTVHGLIPKGPFTQKSAMEFEWDSRNY